MRCFRVVIFFAGVVAFACGGFAGELPPTTAQYFDLMTTYAVYARTSWHDKSSAGGYWGDGLAVETDGNGAVRAASETALVYAELARDLANDTIPAEARSRLEAAGLNRNALLHYVRADLMYLLAHHVATAHAKKPTWGNTWQSPLWLSSQAMAALLVWDDVPASLRENLKTAIESEADRVSARAPKGYHPGDTGAEENAWDLQAPVDALCLDPQNPHADDWWKAARVYAMNVYSTAADEKDDSRVGSDVVRKLVSTSNLFADYTLENHGFFHPDYVQFSGEELGEAWMTFRLADPLNHTHRAAQFEPYAMHHVADVWNNVTRILFLPDGELSFPSGTDWTINCSMEPSYLAFIATHLHDPRAAALEQRMPSHALRRKALASHGNILNDSNLEWWWEPLLARRCTTALLEHELTPKSPAAKVKVDLHAVESKLLPVAAVWINRNASYFVSASWGTRKTAQFIPFDAGDFDHPYMTLPLFDGILPGDADALESIKTFGDATILSLKLTDGRRFALVCLPHSVLFISPQPLRSMALENDRLSGMHHLAAAVSVPQIPPLVPMPMFKIDSSWLNIDGKLAMITSASQYTYKPAGKYNRRSAAYDLIKPADGHAWQMISGASADENSRLAGDFKFTDDGHGNYTIELRDGTDGKRYVITAPLAGGSGEIVAKLKN